MIIIINKITIFFSFFSSRVMINYHSIGLFERILEIVMRVVIKYQLHTFVRFGIIVRIKIEIFKNSLLLVVHIHQ